MEERKVNLKYVYWFIILILFVITVYIYTKSGIFNNLYSVEAFQGYMRRYGSKAYIAFFIVQFLSVIFAPIPNNVMTVAGSAVFGMWQSFIISFFAIIIGSVAAFILARKLGKPFMNKFISVKVSNKYTKLISSKGDILLILMLLLPFFPDDIICFLAGLSHISLKKFITILFISRPWGILCATALGAANIEMKWWVWLLIALISIIFLKYGDRIEEMIIHKFSTHKYKKT